MNKVVTAEEMRRIEQAAVEAGSSLENLMWRAGHAVAETAARAANGGKLLILVGPGNNGGDGIVAASALKQRDHAVTVYTFRRVDLEAAGMGYDGEVVASESDQQLTRLSQLCAESRVIVDALLGIGATRPAEGLLAAILRTVNQNRKQGSCAIAVDIPTGIDADTAAVPGEAFHADVTLSMGFLKVGDVVYPAAEFAGQVEVVDVGISVPLARDVLAFVPADQDIAAVLPRRGVASNKGSSGRLLVIGGSSNYLGAPALASMAAYRAGAGLVEAAVPHVVQQSIAAHVAEAVFRPLPESEGRIALDALPSIAEGLTHARAAVFGPGMGLSDETVNVAREFLGMLASHRDKPALVDADGLNALAKLPNWWETPVEMVLTPHPGEMARLTGLAIADVQADRLGVTRHCAAQWRKVVVLKGAGTVVASPDGWASINPTGGPNLATAGTGDVLSGIIGGLLAQGCSTFDAAMAGTYIHGRAGDLVRAELGDAGTIASDLLAKIPLCRLALTQEP